MRITSKGQVTIPQRIREQAGLLPDTEVGFEIVRGRVILKPLGKRASSGRRTVAPLRGSLQPHRPAESAAVQRPAESGHQSGQTRYTPIRLALS